MTHSLTALLEAYRDLLDRYPALWVLDPSFPRHLHEFGEALAAGDENRCVEVLRGYYSRIDTAVLRTLDAVRANVGATSARAPASREDEPRAPD